MSRTDRPNRRAKVVVAAHPVVEQLMILQHRSELTDKALAANAGYTPSLLNHWRNKGMPSVKTLSDFARAMGHEVQLVPISPKPHVWARLNNDERGSLVRSYYLGGKNNRQIAEALKTTTSSIQGFSFRRNLTPKNAATWVDEGVVQEFPSTHRNRRKLTLAEKRAKLENKASDPATYAAIQLLNAIPEIDSVIADQLGVGRESIGRWRNGRTKISPFLASCVTDLAKRYGL